MSVLAHFEPTRIWLDIGSDRLFAWRNQDGREVALERTADGRFTAACISMVTDELRGLLRGKPPLSRLHVYASIPARGVILRRVQVPKSTATEWPRLLALQLEAEFPLSPDQLAWGWVPIPCKTTEHQHMLLAAVRKEALLPYQELLAPLNGEVRFSLAALDRLDFLPVATPSAIVIHFGKNETEIGVRLEGQPTAIRWLPSVHREATRDIYHFLDSLELPSGMGLYVDPLPTTEGNTVPEPDWIRQAIPPHVTWPAEHRMDQPIGAGQTMANLGVATTFAANPQCHRLILKDGSMEAPMARLEFFPWRTLSVVVALITGIILTPYLEALVLAPRLQQLLARIKADEPRLTIIDRELDFLHHLQENQGPFLDAVYLIAASAPPGCHINSISLNRRGEVNLNGFLQNMNQVGELRSKLIDSGFFSIVVVEDQTPTPDRQRVNFRLTAQWKASSDREGLEIGPKLTNSPTVAVSQTTEAAAANRIPTSPSP